MDINEENIDDEFFEEYGEEMTQAFLSFCNHFKEYICEMDAQLCKDSMLKAHEYADQYNILVKEENGEYLYRCKENDETKFAYGIIQLHLKFTDIIKEINEDMWNKAVYYAADYGGVGRVKFFHAKDIEDEKDTGSR